MFRKVEVPVLGIVENMSYFIAPDTGTRYDIFGHGGARREAERIGVPFLGEVPLTMNIRETSDAGTPLVASEPNGVVAKHLSRHRRQGLGADRLASPSARRRRSSSNNACRPEVCSGSGITTCMTGLMHVARKCVAVPG